MNLFVLLKLCVKHNFTMSFKTRIEALVLTPQVLKFRVKHNFTMSFKTRIEALVLTLCIFSLKIRFFEIIRKPLNLFSEQYQTLYTMLATVRRNIDAQKV